MMTKYILLKDTKKKNKSDFFACVIKKCRIFAQKLSHGRRTVEQ